MYAENLFYAFEKQDFEDFYYDVIFDVDGRELYAHSGILAVASDVFKEILFKNRSTPYKPIQIDGYSYSEFYGFLRLIYSVNEDHYFDERKHIAAYELANIYKVDKIKQRCAKSIANGLFVYNIEKTFQSIEAAYKLLLTDLEKEIKEFINENFDDLVGYDGFINLDKSVIQAFVYFGKKINDIEELGKAVIKWGEHQAMITEEMPKEEKNDLILHYINDILPSFTLKYLLKFFVNQKDLISVIDAKKVKTIQVSVTTNGKTITGTFVDSYGIFEYIKTHESERLLDCYGDKERTFWRESFYIPSTQSSIKKRKNIKWYLLFDYNEHLCIKHHSNIDEEDDYLIAEMKPSNENGKDGEFNIKYKVDDFATVTRKYEQIF